MKNVLTKYVNKILKNISSQERLTTLSLGTVGTVKMPEEARNKLQNTPKTKLTKNDGIKNSTVILEAPQIMHLINSTSNMENYPQINEIVTTFENTLKANLTEEQMNIVKKNLETLRYTPCNFSQSLNLARRGMGGFYDSKSHSVTVNPLTSGDVYHNLFHELLHASTSSIVNGVEYCGFGQINHQSQTELGRAVTEGYTELLTRRLFSNNDRGYSYEVSIAEIMEFIIGKEKMQDLYFKMDLNGLITELGKYSDVNNAKELLSNFDKTLHLHGSKQGNSVNQELSHLYNQNSVLLYEMFQNKTNQFLSTNTIDKYFEESDKFQHLLSQTEKSNRFNAPKKQKRNLKEELFKTKRISQNFKLIQPRTQTNDINKTKNINKPKTLVKTKPANTPKNINGFVDIVTILTIIFLLSIGFSYLILHVR